MARSVPIKVWVLSMAEDRAVVWASSVTLAACVLGVVWVALLLS